MPINIDDLRVLVGACDYSYDLTTGRVCEVEDLDGGRPSNYCGQRAPWVVRDSVYSDRDLYSRGQYICEDCFNLLPAFPDSESGRERSLDRPKPERNANRITRRLPK